MGRDASNRRKFSIASEMYIAVKEIAQKVCNIIQIASKFTKQREGKDV